MPPAKGGEDKTVPPYMYEYDKHRDASQPSFTRSFENKQPHFVVLAAADGIVIVPLFVGLLLLVSLFWCHYSDDTSLGTGNSSISRFKQR